MRRFVFAAITFIAIFPALPADSLPLYTSQPLGMNHSIMDINDHGEVVGDYRGTIQYGYYFDGIRSVPTGLSGDHYSWSSLSAINNNHFAVGLNTRRPQADPTMAIRAVRVHPDSAAFPLLNLGSLTGPDGDSNARDINDANVIVGDSVTASGTRHAVRFETNGTVTDLGTLGGSNSSALGINLRGDIVGNAQDSNGFWRAFLLPVGDTMRDLGTLGGNESSATRINNRGQIAGSATLANGECHAFLYSDGVMQDLGTLAGTNSAAVGLNDYGVVVGTGPFPFVKYPGQPMLDLRNIAGIPYYDFLISATAINNDGFIVVHGFDNFSSYILKPGALSAALRNGVYHLTFSAPQGTQVRLEHSDTLSAWMPLLTNTLTSTQITQTLNPAHAGPKFFRAVITPSR